MATDSKSEKKKRSSTSTSEGRDVSKRRRTSDDEEKSGRGSSRRDEREHGSSHKRSKHHSDKEKKSKEKRKSKDSKHSRNSKKGVKPCELSSDDYFSKNNEFSTWLKEAKNIFFSDLSSERARELFSNFVKKWNADKLEPKYYEGIATAPRTAHSWKIRN